jgi:hypothetical protein
MGTNLKENVGLWCPVLQLHSCHLGSVHSIPATSDPSASFLPRRISQAARWAWMDGRLRSATHGPFTVTAPESDWNCEDDRSWNAGARGVSRKCRRWVTGTFPPAAPSPISIRIAIVPIIPVTHFQLERFGTTTKPSNLLTLFLPLPHTPSH